jgi:hypothetical protein
MLYIRSVRRFACSHWLSGISGVMYILKLTDLGMVLTISPLGVRKYSDASFLQQAQDGV